MKKWLVVMMAFWLTSCSSSGENKSYYQLPVAQGGVQSTASQGNRLLWVEQVSVPDSVQDTLNVTVTGFHGRYDGKVIVSGEWLLNHQGQLIKRPFHIETAQQQDGYDEMVKVLAAAWNQEAAAIAQALKQIP